MVSPSMVRGYGFDPGRRSRGSYTGRGSSCRPGPATAVVLGGYRAPDDDRRGDVDMTLPVAPGTYRLDPFHSQIGFSVVHLGITPVRGLFPDFTGTLRVGDRLEDARLDVSIRTSSVQSGHERRDERIQEPDYFAS